MFNIRSLFVTAFLLATPVIMLPEAPEATPKPAESTPAPTPELLDKVAATSPALTAELCNRIAATMRKELENQDKRRARADAEMREFNNSGKPEYLAPFGPWRVEIDRCQLVDLYLSTREGEENIAATPEEVERCASISQHRADALRSLATLMRDPKIRFVATEPATQAN